MSLIAKSKLSAFVKTSPESTKPSLYKINKETGLSMTVLNKYKADKQKSFDAKVIGKLCEYLGINVQDLIKLEKEDASKKPIKKDN